MYIYGTKNRRRFSGAGKWSGFSAPVSGACVMGLRPGIVRRGPLFLRETIPVT